MLIHRPQTGAFLASHRLCGAHCYYTVLVDLNHVPSETAAAKNSPPEALARFDDDRVGVGTGLEHVTLFDLLVKERVEGVPARA